MDLSVPTTIDSTERLQALEADCRRELEQAREQLTEIQLLLQQTTNEVEKLGQREGAIATRVRDMEINLENYTRADIKAFYTAAHEVSLRLFMMRSQVEQLQARQEQVRERQESLHLILSLLETIDASGVGGEPEPAAGPAKPSTDALTTAASLRRIIEAQESERQRVSRYLHDGPAQTLSNLVLRAEICERMIDRDLAEARSELQGLRGALTTTLQDTRRLIFDLRPMTLDDIGLVATLRRYLTEVGRGQGFTATVRGPENDEALPGHVRALLFRLVQDVLGALTRHAPLEQVTVDLSIGETMAELTLAVRGQDESTAPDLEAVLALDEVRQRLEMLAATIQVSPSGEQGSSLLVVAPLPSA
jgi:two-component system sensor histidine kinase DegS